MISPTADVDQRAHVGNSTRIWHLAQVREDATVGEDCIVGRGAYIDTGVVVGNNCKIQNLALVYGPSVLGDGVFVGPAAVLANDTYPRAINPDGSLKAPTDWKAQGVNVGRGAAIGARAVVLGGITIGEWAMVGAGAVVTKDVPPHALVVGAPARRVAWVGASGQPLQEAEGYLVDPSDGTRYVESDGEVNPA